MAQWFHGSKHKTELPVSRNGEERLPATAGTMGHSYALMVVFSVLLVLSFWNQPPSRALPPEPPENSAPAPAVPMFSGLPGEGDLLSMTRIFHGRQIALDPGHGGMDPGAIGPSETYEKDVNLAIARRLSRLLDAGGATVIMTRTEDVFVSRSARATVANERAADLLISIHANTYPSPSIRGTETYYWTNHPESERLADLIQFHVVDQLASHDRGVRRESYAILREAEMPAVLLECLYLSSPEEEALLTQPTTQQKIANAMFYALLEFFAGDPQSEGT